MTLHTNHNTLQFVMQTFCLESQKSSVKDEVASSGVDADCRQSCTPTALPIRGSFLLVSVLGGLHGGVTCLGLCHHTIIFILMS